MSARKLKGSLLEYVIRALLLNCGFTSVKVQKPWMFEDKGLTFINGRGAAHDADVLMNPPIQMPFSYPFRLNFECKAYNRRIGLSTIRNAMGLRQDINDFEIVSREHLKHREKDRTKTLAIDNRQRFNYQVGVASVDGFTKQAIEFAANNKIPLISLRWLFTDDVCNKFHKINDKYLSKFKKEDLKNLLQFLKGNRNAKGKKFIIEEDSAFRDVYRALNMLLNKVIIGLLEGGDMILLASDDDIHQYLSNQGMMLKARYFYSSNELKIKTEEENQQDQWRLELNNGISMKFHLPRRILSMWENQSFDSHSARGIKRKYFSKIFVFINNQDIPFRIINMEKKWLNNIEG